MAKKNSKKGNGQKAKRSKASRTETRKNFGMQRTTTSPAHTGSGLSKCAEMYAKALVNPWGDFEELPCVPTIPSELTYRFRHIMRGTFQSGTQGTGYMSWNPGNASNDGVSIWFTDGTYAQALGANPFVRGVTGVNSRQKTTLPYNFSLFSAPGANLKARVIASGLRIRTTAAVMTRQGSLTFVRGDNQTDLSQLSRASIENEMSAVRTTVDRSGSDWIYFNYYPQEETDLDFPSGTVNYSTGGPYSNPAMGVAISGAAAANPVTFDWEIVEFWEFAGEVNGVTLPNLMRSHSDPVGLARVVEACVVPPQDLTLKGTATHVASRIIEQMAHSDSAAKTVEDLLGLAGMAIPTVASLVKNLTGLFLL